mmetsp:Transcript_70173/g.121504  ORF Transcript_70173/g.121504 Transcript_70173/m.121504 type:complete len:288 (-) Transcript_70173:345-1208(-)
MVEAMALSIAAHRRSASAFGLLHSASVLVLQVAAGGTSWTPTGVASARGAAQGVALAAAAALWSSRPGCCRRPCCRRTGCCRFCPCSLWRPWMLPSLLLLLLLMLLLRLSMPLPPQAPTLTSAPQRFPPLALPLTQLLVLLLVLLLRSMSGLVRGTALFKIDSAAVRGSPASSGEIAAACAQRTAVLSLSTSWSARAWRSLPETAARSSFVLATSSALTPAARACQIAARILPASPLAKAERKFSKALARFVCRSTENISAATIAARNRTVSSSTPGEYLTRMIMKT